jgi:hypothetical protein
LESFLSFLPSPGEPAESFFEDESLEDPESDPDDPESDFGVVESVLVGVSPPDESVDEPLPLPPEPLRESVL